MATPSGEGDDRSSETYHSKWDKFAKDEEASLAAEDAALAAQSDAALGLSAAADAPRSDAEAAERAKREALKAAKQLFKDKDMAALGSKLVIADEVGASRLLTADDMAADDMGGEKHAVHIKGAKDCTYTLDALMRVAKVGRCRLNPALKALGICA